MKVIAVLSPKGGAGKSTLATNLARALQLDGHRVLLVDTDPQATASDWRAVGEDGLPTTISIHTTTVDKQLPGMAESFDFTVIDGSAKLEKVSISAMKAADLVLIPVGASAADVWSVSELAELVRARQEALGTPKAAFVLSRIVQNTTLASDAQEALEGLELPVLEGRTVQRQAYAAAIGEGVSVVETGDEKAASEIHTIKDEVLRLL